MLMSGISGEMSNREFGRLCGESRFAFWGMVTVVVLQVVMGGVVVEEWVSTRRHERRGEKGMEMGVLEADRKTEFSF